MHEAPRIEQWESTRGVFGLIDGLADICLCKQSSKRRFIILFQMNAEQRVWRRTPGPEERRSSGTWPSTAEQSPESPALLEEEGSGADSHSHSQTTESTGGETLTARSTLLPTTLSRQPSSAALPSRRRKHRPFAPRWLIAALLAAGALALAGFGLHVKPSVERQLLAQTQQELMEQVLDVFGEGRQQADCFLLHESFFTDTEDARMAQASFQCWLQQTARWLDAVKGAGAPAAALGEEEGPKPWEAALLRGALLCQKLPALEASAAVGPYNPVDWGFSRDSFGASSSALHDSNEPSKNAAAKGKLQQTQQAVITWLGEVGEALAAVAADCSAKLLEAEDAEVRFGWEAKRLEALKALHVYEELQTYLYACRPPQGRVTLQAVDQFVFRRSLAAAKAAAAVASLASRVPPPPLPPAVAAAAAAAHPPREGQEEAAPDSPASPALMAQAAGNRYVPPWVVQLLLRPGHETVSAAVKLRLAVYTQGPPFVSIEPAALAEYQELLKDTVGSEQREQELRGLPADAEDVSDRQRRLLAVTMQTEIALAAFEIPKLEARFAALKDGVQPQLHDLLAVKKQLTRAYGKLASTATRWMARLEVGAKCLSKEEEKELEEALKQLAVMSYLSQALVEAHARAHAQPDLAEKHEEDIKKTAGLLALSEVSLSCASRGKLHQAGLVPAWWANIRS
ncbi:hypothetical protein Efla_000289 [Eimeria flavescens]